MPSIAKDSFRSHSSEDAATKRHHIEYMANSFAARNSKSLDNASVEEGMLMNALRHNRPDSYTYTNGFKTPTANQPNGHKHLETPELSKFKLFILTAKSEKSLRKSAENLRRWVFKRDRHEDDLKNLAYTLACRRSVMQWRFSFVASSWAKLTSCLKPDIVRPSKFAADVKVTFIFTGQGAQWPTMGRELIHENDIFRASMEYSARILRNLGAQWDLIDELELDDTKSRIN